MTDYSTLPSARPLNLFDLDLPEALVIFGSGGRGRRGKRILEQNGVRVLGFVDNNPDKHGTSLDGCTIHSPESLTKAFSGLPVIICSYAETPISQQLAAMGIQTVYTDGAQSRSAADVIAHNRDKLECVAEAVADDASRTALKNAAGFRCNQPYVHHSTYPLYGHLKVRPEKGDVIIDGGAAHGDTLEMFLNHCAGECEIHLFEPTPKLFRELEKAVESTGMDTLYPVNAALWNEATELMLADNSPDGHDNIVSANSSHGISVPAVTLDSYVREAGLEKVDLIKLDIEGAELEALKGAKETIKRFRPKLQICLYHKVEDLWTLPLLIKELVPEYTMYIGLHTCRLLDLVLYCRID